jgi:hypothetical protein
MGAAFLSFGTHSFVTATSMSSPGTYIIVIGAAFLLFGTHIVVTSWDSGVN